MLTQLLAPSKFFSHEQKKHRLYKKRRSFVPMTAIMWCSIIARLPQQSPKWNRNFHDCDFHFLLRHELSTCLQKAWEKCNINDFPRRDLLSNSRGSWRVSAHSDAVEIWFSSFALPSTSKLEFAICSKPDMLWISLFCVSMALLVSHKDSNFIEARPIHLAPNLQLSHDLVLHNHFVRHLSSCPNYRDSMKRCGILFAFLYKEI